MRKRKIVEDQIPIDSIMCQMAQCLISDFRTTFKDATLFSDLFDALRSEDANRIRVCLPTPTEEMDVAMYKATYQLQCLLKRHRFQKDLFTERELEQKAINTFLETQVRISEVNFNELPTEVGKVIKRARDIITHFLGPYDDEEHRASCRFGRRASVGIPGRLACEAERWELPITGSKCQISWFDSEMSQYESIQDYWRAQQDSDPVHAQRSIYREIDALKLTFVPKTFKAVRSIVPNSTIGSYMSYGLGEMIRTRLKRKGYDIRTLQRTHRDLAESASFFGDLATADLSSASDSISVALVEQLFPSDWFDILCQSRIDKIVLPGIKDPVAVNTFATMGIGYTFPLQTLVFLALVRSIQDLVSPWYGRGVVSVYGDDLIYPAVIHKFVSYFFKKLGFILNEDKTFSRGHFRESCGGDYYRGRDVRPFQPEGGIQRIHKGKPYEAVLYKMINGFLFRWSEYEIGNTLKFLTAELERNESLIKRVPCDFPADAGIQSTSLDSWEFLSTARCARTKSVGHGLYRFPYLAIKARTRKEVRHEPYFWLALREHTGSVFDYSDPMQLRVPVHLVHRIINDVTGAGNRTPLLTWKHAQGPKKFTRSSLSGKRQPRLEAHITISDSGSYTSQLGTSTFGDRR